jgi:hypothetical protein
MRILDKYYTDTESIGFFGPTVLIQYSLNRAEPIIHNIWQSSVRDTLTLIWKIVNNCVIGFNLTHDWFHFTRTANILKELPLDSPPSMLDYLDVEQSEGQSPLCLGTCLKPQSAMDLMLIGRKTKFQAAMGQKNILLKKIPIPLVHQVIKELEQIEIPSIYFAKSLKGCSWNIVPLHKNSSREMNSEELGQGEEADTDFCNLKLIFAPSTALKNIMQYIGKEVIFHEDLSPLKYPTEYSCYPRYSGWVDVFDQHIFEWSKNPKRQRYAKEDVSHLFTLEDYLEIKDIEYIQSPYIGDIDSTLACAVGGMHWEGFAIDNNAIKFRYNKAKDFCDWVSSYGINVNSQRQVKTWLGQVAKPIDKSLLSDTSAETLKEIISSYEDYDEAFTTYPLINRCQMVLGARKMAKESQLYKYLLDAGRMHVVNKIIGTKSNRMSGGSETYIKSKGAINAQGIKKGPEVRSCFTLANRPLVLCGGDFDGYEVNIAEALYECKILTEELNTGKKMHALFGAEMYNMTYEEVLATSELNINHPQGYYQRAKRGFFALLYDAQEDTLSRSMWISVEEAKAGIERFLAKYKEIDEHRKDIKRRFTAIVQQGGIGSAIVWQDPEEYIESFLGYRRYFTLEYSIMRELFSMARNPSTTMLELGKGLLTKRRDRIQTIVGAISSALYQSVFSLQSSIIRAASNHEIQSPGGEMCKRLQAEVWSIQPVGIGPWVVMPLNMHDEIESPCHPDVVDIVEEKVKNFIIKYKKYVPRLSMTWKKYLSNWGDK